MSHTMRRMPGKTMLQRRANIPNHYVESQMSKGKMLKTMVPIHAAQPKTIKPVYYTNR